jgi:hypothetical protein
MKKAEQGNVLIKERLLKTLQLRKSVFPIARSDGQKQRLDTNHKKSEFDTCSDGLADVIHREHPFGRMSGRKSEDCGWRSFFLQSSKR